MIDAAVAYYDAQCDRLAAHYDRADMRELYALFERFVAPGDRVLDLGFGSGRDLRRLDAMGAEVWGADASEAFVSRFKNLRPDLRERLYRTALPHPELPESLYGTFDALVCIAVWMHLPHARQDEAAHALKNLLKPGGRIILSYSTAPRKDDPRFFETLDAEEVAFRFIKLGGSLMETSVTADGMDREMAWTVQVFEFQS